MLLDKYFYRVLLSTMSRFSDFFKELVPASEPEQELSPEVLPVGYNTDATDRDGDGLVQDGTPFERPAPASAKVTRKIGKKSK